MSKKSTRGFGHVHNLCSLGEPNRPKHGKRQKNRDTLMSISIHRNSAHMKIDHRVPFLRLLTVLFCAYDTCLFLCSAQAWQWGIRRGQAINTYERTHEHDRRRLVLICNLSSRPSHGPPFSQTGKERKRGAFAQKSILCAVFTRRETGCCSRQSWGSPHSRCRDGYRSVVSCIMTRRHQSVS